MVRSPNQKASRTGGCQPETSEGGGGEHGQSSDVRTRRDVAERRVLRSRYLAVQNLISDKREDISSIDSDNFKSIILEVESLHELVQKPREQVADAVALLDIASTLVTSVKSQKNGVSPSEFIAALLKNFGEENSGASLGNSQNILHWSDVGHAFSDVFRNAGGCCTMIGPMYNELKQRKAFAQRKRTRPTETAQTEELADSGAAVKAVTDKNMSSMFDILRRKKNVELEHLVLNRETFAQTIENIFALSFLVKDGRAEITVNSSGRHIVSPRNAPADSTVASGQISYSHFVFRFDFEDWKLMADNVTVGDELMPHRTDASISNSKNGEAEAAAHATPIRKLCRNRGLIIQEESVVDSPEADACAQSHKKKRLFG